MTDTSGLFARALLQAQNGKPILLEKLRFVAAMFKISEGHFFGFRMNVTDGVVRFDRFEIDNNGNKSQVQPVYDSDGRLVDVFVNGRSLVGLFKDKCVQRGWMQDGDDFSIGTILFDEATQAYSIALTKKMNMYDRWVYTAALGTDGETRESLKGYYANSGNLGLSLDFLVGSHKTTRETYYFDIANRINNDITFTYDNNGNQIGRVYKRYGYFSGQLDEEIVEGSATTAQAENHEVQTENPEVFTNRLPIRKNGP